MALLLLLGVTAIQWVLISYLLQERHSHYVDLSSGTSNSAVDSLPLTPPHTNRKAASGFGGVATAIFFSAPAWFHRRYPILIQNALANIPNDWAVQLFVHPPVWKDRVLPYHPGMTRLLEQHHDRIIVTELPSHLVGIKQPNQRIPLDPWFWKALVADKVLLFSGNGILCTHGNTQEHWEALQKLDYVGVPWNKFDKEGGDGSTHSYRNRNLMLDALEYASQKNMPMNPPESTFFVQTLRKMMQDNNHQISPKTVIRLASPTDTQWFGGVQTTNSTVKGHLRPIPPPPMVVSGTQAKLSFQEREDLLLVCPELKVIFPSLHEPACFGAHPDPVKCRATICALQDKLPGSGC